MTWKHEDLADAYVRVAQVNHYLVGVMLPPGFTLDDLDATEQVLISRDNAADNKSPVLNLALDLIEQDRFQMLVRLDREDCR